MLTMDKHWEVGGREIETQFEARVKARARVLGWEPAVRLEDRLARTYKWIEAKVKEEGT